MGFDAFGFLMGNRAQTDVTFCRAECGLGLLNLDVPAPQLCGFSFRGIGAQQIGPFEKKWMASFAQRAVQLQAAGASRSVFD